MDRLTFVGIIMIVSAFSNCKADGVDHLPEIGPLSSKGGLTPLPISLNSSRSTSTPTVVNQMIARSIVNPTTAVNTTIPPTTHTTKPSNHTTAHSTVTPTPSVNTTTPRTTKPSNHTTAHSTVTPTPSVNTTTLHTTKPSNHTTAHSTVTPTPSVNTTTPHTTKPSNHTTAHSTVTPTPSVNTTTPRTTKPSNHTTANSTVTPTPAVNTTTPRTTKPTNHTTVHSTVTHTPSVNTTTLPANSTTHITVPTTTVVPTFAPAPSTPATGNYSVSDKGANCIMALMGLELIFHNNTKDAYLNIDPSQTHASGNCGKSNSNLNLTFPNGFINFNFVKDDSSYFVDEIDVLLHPLNVQKLMKQNLFHTKLGSSYKCANKDKVVLGGNVTLLMVNVKLQAFEIQHNNFGAVSECSADLNSSVALAIGLTVVILIVLALIIYLIYRMRKSSGYQRI